MIKVAVVGYGNIGKYAVQAIESAPDLKLAGVVRREVKKDQLPPELKDVPVVSSIDKLDAVDVALLSVPTRVVPVQAEKLLAQGINTVDSFDLHGEELINYRAKIRTTAKANNAVAVLSAGWDPGTDSMVRALMEIMAPQGLTFTNFGPGMSMGHSVAVKALPGVKDALSMTIPKGAGLHRRLVYLELESGTKLEQIQALIQADPYFSKDETFIYQVDSIKNVQDVGHGVLLERTGTSGKTGNQQFKWEMRINNPALTSQVMVAAARASMKQSPGAYTLLEIPLIDYFSENNDDLIKRLV